MYTIHSEERGGTINGFKIRELFVRSHAHDHTFFYGVNFEFSVNQLYWEPKRFTSEIRPIIGVHLHPVDIIFNPIVDTQYTGGFGNLEFVPATRVAYNVNDKWAAAIEEYADCGPLRHFLPGNDQFHEVWAVTDRTSKFLSLETGVGFGVTAGGRQIDFEADAMARPQLKGARRQAPHLVALLSRDLFPNDESLVMGDVLSAASARKMNNSSSV